MKTISYRVGDLRSMIKESSKEFKPVMGLNVDIENKRNNEKSYKDSEKRAKNYDDGLKPQKKSDIFDRKDPNKMMLDLNPSNEPSKEYREKVKAQLKGYTSKAEEDNDIEKAADFDEDSRLEKNFTSARDYKEKINKQRQKGGLVARTLPDEAFDKNHLYENKFKKLYFKHTHFLNEEQMLSRIPEEYKKDGQNIIMLDKGGNEYIVECVYSKKSKNIETNIVSYSNKKKLDEQKKRMAELMTYSSKDVFGKASNAEKINENNGFMNLMDNARKSK